MLRLLLHSIKRFKITLSFAVLKCLPVVGLAACGLSGAFLYIYFTQARPCKLPQANQPPFF